MVVESDRVESRRDYPAMPMALSLWARTQRELLRLERDEEKAQVADTIAQLPAQVCTWYSSTWYDS